MNMMNMRRVLVILFLMACAVRGAFASSRPAPREKLRTIVTTDGEVDDRCSMARFLLYTNEWEVLGLIHSSSVHHWRGDGDHKPHSWQGTDWLDRQIDQYEQAFANLRRHDENYPSPEYLRKQVFVGNVAYPGEMTTPTPGSRRIVEVLLEDDPRTVWLQAWGGANTIARALKTIQEEHPDRVEEVSAKAVIYLIALQDDTYQQYIARHWPGLRVILNEQQFSAIAYGWRDGIPRPMHSYFNAQWMRANILRDHGALCGGYEAHRAAFLSEGDSLAFMHLIDVGLDNTVNPDFGGWGGRFARDGKTSALWKDTPDDGDALKPIWRWASAFQNDWAARADWCVKAPSEANHPPRVLLTHATRLSVMPGEQVTLDASPSRDGDGHPLSYAWWHYIGAGTYPKAVSISDANQPRTRLLVPADVQPGQTIHIICEVTDGGTPPLTRYRRVIVDAADRKTGEVAR